MEDSLLLDLVEEDDDDKDHSEAAAECIPDEPAEASPDPATAIVITDDDDPVLVTNKELLEKDPLLAQYQAKVANIGSLFSQATTLHFTDPRRLLTGDVRGLNMAACDSLAGYWRRDGGAGLDGPHWSRALPRVWLLQQGEVPPAHIGCSLQYSPAYLSISRSSRPMLQLKVYSIRHLRIILQSPSTTRTHTGPFLSLTRMATPSSLIP